MVRFQFIFVVVWVSLSPAFTSGAVLQWGFVDPANPSLGKKPIRALAPDGAGAHFDNIIGLSGRDLTKAYLFQANIQEFLVSTTILNDAYLAEADMYNLGGEGLIARGADMSRSNLQLARLERADLSMASFRNADLTNAYLGSSTLTGVDFTGAKITDARFSNTIAKGFTDQQLYQTASYQQGELGAIQLWSNDLQGWNFTGQRMVRANFSGTQLGGAVFTDALVTMAVFSQSDLISTQLYATGSYKNRQLDDMEFNGLDMSGWNFANQSLIRARITSTKLSGAVFDGANLTNAYIGKDMVVQKDVSFRGANLTNSTFSRNGRWERADFTGANLEGARLISNAFVDSKFDDAIIRGAKLSSLFSPGFTLESFYSTASYKFGDLTNIEIEYGDFSGADFRGIDFSGARLVSLTLDGADFRGATIIGAHIGATLEGADFREANLTDTHIRYDPVSFIDFRGANLSGASFGDTSLVNADLSDATVFGAKLSTENNPQNLSPQQLYSTASYKAGLLGPITLGGDLRGWDFRDQDLTDARFSRYSQLEGASWAGATLRETKFFVNTMAETDFRLADVRQVRFSNSDLDRSDFRGTDLSGAEFSSSSLVEARFDGSQLTNVRFLRANLEGANFTDADLRGTDFASMESFVGADFSRADIRGADFANAMSDGFTVQQLFSTRSYQHRDLSGVNFESADFPGIDLSEFQLTGADFNRSNLVGADLSETDLVGVLLASADITDVNFTDAVVRRAGFQNTSSKGFTRAMFESTVSYKNRKLDGIDLSGNDLQNWDFHGQDLREARFASSELAGALFDLADLRGAELSSDLTGIAIERAILPDGTLSLLQVQAGEVLTIASAPRLVRLIPINPRDPVDPNPIAPGVKVIGRSAQIDGTLELLLSESEWESTLVFSPGSTVTIDGVLKLAFDELADLSGATGRSYNLFNWPSGLSGEFDVVTDPNHVWDLSGLYTTGVVQLVAVVPEPSTMMIVTGLVICSTLTRRHRGMRRC